MKFIVASAIAFLLVSNTSAKPESDFVKCRKGCPDMLRPVCGFDGKEYKIFDTDCDMSVENCMQQVRHESCKLYYTLEKNLISIQL